MPAVNAELMFQAMRDAKADFNQVVYWSRLLSWKNQTLTPNPDTIYVFPFFDTKDVGPMVLEIPPADDEASITGSIDDAWQTALEDVGPAGVDKGKGGKYLILPPDYKEKAPDGYIALPSATYTGFVIPRSNLKGGSDADIAKAVAYGKRVKFYPLSQAVKPPETKFVDAIDGVAYSMAYFSAKHLGEGQFYPNFHSSSRKFLFSSLARNRGNQSYARCSLGRARIALRSKVTSTGAKRM